MSPTLPAVDMRSLALCLLVLAAPALAQPSLGETTSANSGAAAAQGPFLRGLLLLHSFEYDDAREAFQRARQVDPGFAMAAWGEAMTHHHPVWQRQDLDAARAALAGVTGEGATDRERAYLATLAVLFGDDDAPPAGTKEARDDRYAEAMRQLAERYPDDPDARTLYALALLGTAHEGRDFSTYMKAAAVAEEVFDEHPRHPGAAHYLVHAYDDPVHAPLGLRPARVYADVAPAASHALHMPSHIYLALGMWDEVASMNRRSFGAAKANTDRRGEPLNGHGWHALWWWHYAATQLDDAGAAAELLALAHGLADEDPGGTTAQAHVVRIGAQHAVAFDEPGDWRPIDPDGVGLNTVAIQETASGWLAVRSGRNTLARTVADGLAASVEADDDPSWAARSAALVLDGLVLIGEGDSRAGTARLRAAAEIENAAPLTFGPPSPVVPSNEALGWALLEGGDLGGAEAAFEAALARAPGRRQSLAGLAAARTAAR